MGGFCSINDSVPDRNIKRAQSLNKNKKAAVSNGKSRVEETSTSAVTRNHSVPSGPSKKVEQTPVMRGKEVSRVDDRKSVSKSTSVSTSTTSRSFRQEGDKPLAESSHLRTVRPEFESLAVSATNHSSTLVSVAPDTIEKHSTRGVNSAQMQSTAVSPTIDALAGPTSAISTISMDNIDMSDFEEACIQLDSFQPTLVAAQSPPATVAVHAHARNSPGGSPMTLNDSPSGENSFNIETFASDPIKADAQFSSPGKNRVGSTQSRNVASPLPVPQISSSLEGLAPMYQVDVPQDLSPRDFASPPKNKSWSAQQSSKEALVAEDPARIGMGNSEEFALPVPEDLSPKSSSSPLMKKFRTGESSKETTVDESPRSSTTAARGQSEVVAAPVQDPVITSQSAQPDITTTTASSATPPIIKSMIPSHFDQLNELNKLYPWIPNSTCIRPSSEMIACKRKKSADIEKNWYSFTDFILHEVFGKPMVKLASKTNKLFVLDRKVTQMKVFRPNDFPYDVKGHHWVMWYGTSVAPADMGSVNDDIENELKKILGDTADYDFAWYINPKITIPEFFHVQVFWTSESYDAAKSDAA